MHALKSFHPGSCSSSWFQNHWWMQDMLSSFFASNGARPTKSPPFCRGLPPGIYSVSNETAPIKPVVGLARNEKPRPASALTEIAFRVWKTYPNLECTPGAAKTSAVNTYSMRTLLSKNKGSGDLILVRKKSSL